MKIILTENQFKLILESEKDKNSKPATLFDNLYGTELSQRYYFGKNLSSDDVWNMWLECRRYNDCENIRNLIKELQTLFPYYDIKKLSDKQKLDVLLGMASEFNPIDIVYFVVNKIPYVQNTEQLKLEKKLPDGVAKKIQWVLSPESIQIIKNKFGVHEI